MSYDHQQDGSVAPIAGAAATDADIALGTAAVVGLFYAGIQPVVCKAITAQVVTTFDTADTVLTIRKRITPGSDTGSTILGTLTIPNGAVAPNTYYKKFDGAKLSAGEELVVSTDGGTTAGTAIIRLDMTPSWEAVGNNAKLIASV
jgi:hypothetical protein